MNEHLIQKALKSFKDLSNKQSYALIEIIREQKPLEKNEIVVILDKRKICSKQTAYRLIDELVDRDVLFENKGKYTPINTKMLLDDCSKSITIMETEIEGLEISKEWNETDPQNKSRTLIQENHIIHEIYTLFSKYELIFYCKQRDKNKLFWKNLKDRISPRMDIKIIEGNYNCIIFKNKNKKPVDSGIIILSTRITKKGEEKFYGNIIFDEELINLFGKKGV